MILLSKYYREVNTFFLTDQVCNGVGTFFLRFWSGMINIIAVCFTILHFIEVVFVSSFVSMFEFTPVRG